MGIINKAIERGLQLFTNTPVVGVEDQRNGSIPAAGPSGNWRIRTTKGDVVCTRIFHATNGYISNLVPELSSKVVPVKGHVVAMKPCETYSTKPMQHTSGIQWGEDFDYMIQRSNDGNPIIYGGGDLAHARKLLGPIGDSDDSTLTPEIIRALRGFPRKHFRDWSDEEPELRYAWSGVMGFTADSLPFVGELPNRPQQFTAAGYSGHGWSIFLSTTIGLILYPAVTKTCC